MSLEAHPESSELFHKSEQHNDSAKIEKALTTKTQKEHRKNGHSFTTGGHLRGERSSKRSKKAAHNMHLAGTASTQQFPPKKPTTTAMSKSHHNYSSTKRQTITEAQNTEKEALLGGGAGGTTDAAETDVLTHQDFRFADDMTSTRHIQQISRHMKTCAAVAHRQHNSYMQMAVYTKTVQNLSTNYQTKLTSVENSIEKVSAEIQNLYDKIQTDDLKECHDP